jgi:hypothetical protein
MPLTTIMTSPNGVAWTRRPNPWDANALPLNDVAWNGSFYVCAGFPNISPSVAALGTSSNGVTWTQRPSPLDQSGTGDAFCISWSPHLGLWCAGGFGPPAICTSPDGVIWTGRSSPYDGLAVGTPPPPKSNVVSRLFKEGIIRV